MNRKFSRKELERLGRTEDEIKLVMEYQKKLPILTDSDAIEKFAINSRILHEQLGVKKKFSTWIKSNLRDYLEDVDFIISSPRETDNKNSKFVIEDEYFITLGLAKEIAMYTGKNSQASDELKRTSRIVRKYFILMEQIVIENKEWIATRNPQKANYIPMCKAYSESIHRMLGRYGDDNDFKPEANRLNIIATGSTAQSIKNYLGLGVNALIRDSLLNDYNEKIAFLQEQNILLFPMDLTTVQRVKMLISFFDTKYPNAKPIKDYHDRDYLIKAREEMINGLMK